MHYRDPLAKVRGLGSAKNGTHHWWMQRVTAIALIPLAFWFIERMISSAFADLATLKTWMESPFQAMAMAIFTVVMCYHARLGMQVIIEDYMHNEASKITYLVVNTFVFTVLAIMAVMAIAKLHFG